MPLGGPDMNAIRAQAGQLPLGDPPFWNPPAVSVTTTAGTTSLPIAPKGALVDIWMIWADTGDDVFVLENAWPSDRAEEDTAGWNEALEAAAAGHGVGNIRVVVTSVDLNAVQRAFDPPRV